MIFEKLKNFTVIDTETTGLSKYRRIVEFAAVKFRNGIRVDELDILINPSIHIPDSTSSINHIYDHMVEIILLLSSNTSQYIHNSILSQLYKLV